MTNQDRFPNVQLLLSMVATPLPDDGPTFYSDPWRERSVIQLSLTAVKKGVLRVRCCVWLDLQISLCFSFLLLFRSIATFCIPIQFFQFFSVVGQGIIDLKISIEGIEVKWTCIGHFFLNKLDMPKQISLLRNVYINSKILEEILYNFFF